MRNVRAGVIDATSQQYPLLMASLGVAAVVKFAKTGKKASGYTDTGVNLIAEEGRWPAFPPRTSRTASPTAGARRDPSATRPGRAAALRSRR